MTDDWLRDALDDAVSDVEPREALDSIRNRTKVTPMSSKRPWIYGVGGAVLATAATITAFAVVNSGGATNAGKDDPGFANPPSSSATDSPTTTTPGVGTQSAPVYYLGEVTFHQGEGGDMQTAFRLFREWHDVQVTPGATALAKGALQAMFDAPADADYSTAWKGEVLGVTHEDGVINVDLSGISAMSVGSETAELSVQQLVYTVQAALSVADDDAATDPVQILVDGEPAGDLWGSVDASQPIARADATGVQAPVWITEPAEGASVAGPVTVQGVAQVFEGNVNWRLLKDGTEVDNGFATASEGAPAFGEYEFELENVAPGSYTLQVFEASALDGSDTFMDTKTFTVE
ncbi:MAG TPA: Gmad2 immunoglobulin-like domain-containing protein [Nocardioidaceae bacterium]|nr:Gmad2 immunoglobulin-like domain-containing protein [Nocardioidaceae bacterium]